MEQFNVTIPPKLAHEVRLRATQEGRSLSSCARDALTLWLQHEPEYLEDRFAAIERRLSRLEEVANL